MKKIVNYILIGVGMLVLMSSCDYDDPSKTSIFVDPQEEPSDFDLWLMKNYRSPYNVDFKYRLDDKETDFNYNVVPAREDLSIKLAILIKHLWYDAYNEEAGFNFMRENSPRVLHLLGSAEWNPTNNLIRLGAAEGGVKISITMVNTLDINDIKSMNEYYFNTMHHEFAHILHQKKVYPTEFNLISQSEYSPDGWHNRRLEDYAPLGFITDYAGSEPREDFVETISNYLTLTDEDLEKIFTVAGEEGSSKILEKLEICRGYLMSTWDINIDNLRKIVQRRQSEIPLLNLDKGDVYDLIKE